ncbi:MAG TPA: 16S rRNA (adenine(1518)-N(6)/adenine(1519)-N(6))-dimethyltransferase RsmA [Parcubacteria group bacterium]|jgi:16S rRNA (adenine1518-N6/adenine1519-N6)-dimethyltransferase|nr:16S rRNA (adenine(1518)-N(6)/adenine(1519)-N(6))-dimethyltransferase RsmA [Parcubacteria group bacterium]
MLKKKSLGQNFLKSKSVVSAIIDASDITPEEIILEIGPGEGFMTEELLKCSGKVIVVEKDHRLIPVLQEKFKEYTEVGKLDVLEKDILNFDIESLKYYKHPYKVIANIPYYITGQIIRMFLESDFEPLSMTLLVQKEVAQRILAKDGKESLLSLSVKVFGEPKIVRYVPRGAFSPVPNVDSAVIIIQSISKDKLGGLNPKIFFKILHAGFAHKRKQLLSNLSIEFSKDIVTKTFENLGVNPKARAEDLSLSTWLDLANKLNQK